ncbi:MAG: universal stress protein [Gammaproteobacteria bacterium]|nr:universal stress protein [Gammaproteobacteria bacterium]
MFRNILIPTDGSALSRKAIVGGVALAKLAGAKITAVFAAPAPTPVLYRHLLPVGYATPQRHAAMIDKAARRYLDVVEKAARKARVPCETLCVTNDFPADAILAVAKRKKCDLIYMASHGRRGLRGALLGSETQKVLAQTRIPVLIHR